MDGSFKTFIQQVLQELSFLQWQSLLGLLPSAQDLTLRGKLPMTSSDVSSFPHRNGQSTADDTAARQSQATPSMAEPVEYLRSLLDAIQRNTQPVQRYIIRGLGCSPG